MTLDDFEPVAEVTADINRVAWLDLSDKHGAGCLLYGASHLQQLIDQCNAKDGEIELNKVRRPYNGRAMSVQDHDEQMDAMAKQLATLQTQNAELLADAERANRTVELYEQLSSPFYKLIPMSDPMKLRELGYELKYLPIYADPPDPTYIVNWVWEVRDNNGASVTQAHKWMYSAIDAAIANAKEGE